MQLHSVCKVVQPLWSPAVRRWCQRTCSAAWHTWLAGSASPPKNQASSKHAIRVFQPWTNCKCNGRKNQSQPNAHGMQHDGKFLSFWQCRTSFSGTLAKRSHKCCPPSCSAQPAAEYRLHLRILLKIVQELALGRSWQGAWIWAIWHGPS